MADYTKANELGEDATRRYQAMKAGLTGKVSTYRRDVLTAEWQAAHHLWWAELQRTIELESQGK